MYTNNNEMIIDHETAIVARDKIKRDSDLSKDDREYYKSLVDDLSKFYDFIIETAAGVRHSVQIIGYKIPELVESLVKYGAFLFGDDKEQAIEIVDMYIVDHKNLNFVSLKDGRVI